MKLFKKIKKIFQIKKPIKTEKRLSEKDKDRLQYLFMKMHRHQNDGAMERAKETQAKLNALKSAIKADRVDPARSLRAENDFCVCGQIKHVGYDKCRDCLEDEWA